MFAASAWPKTPNTPHSSWNLSSSIGSVRTFSCTASPGERGERSVQGWHLPCNDAKTSRVDADFRAANICDPPARLPDRQAFAEAAVRLASAHAGGQGGAHRRRAHEAAPAVPAAHAENPLRRGREAAGVWSGEPARHAEAARRPRRPGPRHHSTALRLEGGEVGPSHRGADARPTRVLGAARLQQYGASVARRSLLVALALALPASAAPRQNVLEYVRGELA